MILFLGDSFTYGQGLFWEKWSKECKDIHFLFEKYGLPEFSDAELIDYNSDLFRIKNHFPALVSKHFNQTYVTKWGNAGSNWDLYHQIDNLEYFAPQFRSSIKFIVIQFTDFTRDDNVSKLPTHIQDELLEVLTKNDNTLICEFQVKIINDIIRKKINVPWYGFSWRSDIGKILKKKYEQNYIPLIYEDSEHFAFENLRDRNSNFFLDELLGISDEHFSVKGHEFLSKNIIKKIETHNNNSIELFLNNNKKNKII